MKGGECIMFRKKYAIFDDEGYNIGIHSWIHKKTGVDIYGLKFLIVASIVVGVVLGIVY